MKPFSEVLSDISFNWSNIVKSIDVTTTDSKNMVKEGKNMIWSLMPQYPACQTIDLNEYFDFKTNVPSYIEFNFNKISNLGVKIKIGDKRRSLTRRTLESSYFDYEGVPIEIENLKSGVFYEYTIKLLETNSIKVGNGKSCVDYPTSKFSSFNHCDMVYVYNEMKNKYKIMPFWAARNLDEVTNFT